MKTTFHQNININLNPVKLSYVVELNLTKHSWYIHQSNKAYIYNLQYIYINISEAEVDGGCYGDGGINT